MKKYKKLSKDEINSLPQIQFNGDIEVLSSNDNVQVAVNHLMNYDLIGFDTETKPTFVPFREGCGCQPSQLVVWWCRPLTTRQMSLEFRILDSKRPLSYVIP